MPGEELLGQRADDVPLHRARILRLVHQDVIETAVELVEHPFDSARRSQQARGLADQVVEVERGLPGLGGAVALHDGIAQPHERQRGIEELQLAALFVQSDHALLRAREQRVDIGVRRRELLGHQRLARIAVAGEEDVAQGRDAPGGAAGGQRGSDLLAKP